MIDERYTLFLFVLRSTAHGEEEAPKKYHTSTNPKLCVPPISEPPDTKAQAYSLPGSENQVRRDRGYLLFPSAKSECVSAGRRSADVLTDVKRLTPDTHISWEIRFPASIRYAEGADEAGVDRLEIPCFMSGMRNRKMGRERKCYTMGTRVNSSDYEMIKG